MHTNYENVKNLRFTLVNIELYGPVAVQVAVYVQYWRPTLGWRGGGQFITNPTYLYDTGWNHPDPDPAA